VPYVSAVSFELSLHQLGFEGGELVVGELASVVQLAELGNLVCNTRRRVVILRWGGCQA